MSARVCPSCGSAVAPDERFCPNCGSRIEASTPAISPTPPTAPVSPSPFSPPPASSVDVPPAPKRANNGLVIALIVGVALLCVIGGITAVAISMFAITDSNITIQPTAGVSSGGSASGGGIASGVIPGQTTATPRPQRTARPTADSVATSVAATTLALQAEVAATQTALVAVVAEQGVVAETQTAIAAIAAEQAAAVAATQTALAENANAGAAATATAAEVEAIFARAQRVFFDEFVDNRNNWFTGVYDEIETDLIEDGVFKVIWAGDGFSYEIYEVRDFADFIAEVDCLVVAGGGNASCGIVFAQVPDVGFYEFEVFEDYYRLNLIADDLTELVSGDPTDIIAPGQPFNLRVVREGSRIRLWINQVLVGDLDDATFGSGKVGVSTNSYDEAGGVEVNFDNIAIWAFR